jgi:hypothetical protein
MARSVHLLITAASFLTADGTACAPPPPPHLRTLAQLLAPGERIDCGAPSPAMPWELALARSLGLPAQPGRIPWAAFESGTTGTPCAWIRPCHWQVGRDHIALSDPAALTLAEGDSRALLEAAAPYFAEDGIALAFHAADRWLARGEMFRDLSTTSMERAVGNDVTGWLPAVTSPGGTLLRRLQNEMQMLFYTHQVTDARQAAGLAAVNSFWVDGTGALDVIPAATDEVIVERSLRPSAVRRDAQAHAAAWNAVDGAACAELLELLQREGSASVKLTLAGDRAAQTLVAGRTGFLARIQSILGLDSAPGLLLQL